MAADGNIIDDIERTETIGCPGGVIHFGAEAGVRPALWIKPDPFWVYPKNFVVSLRS